MIIGWTDGVQTLGAGAAVWTASGGVAGGAVVTPPADGVPVMIFPPAIAVSRLPLRERIRPLPAPRLVARGNATVRVAIIVRASATFVPTQAVRGSIAWATTAVTSRATGVLIGAQASYRAATWAILGVSARVSARLWRPTAIVEGAPATVRCQMHVAVTSAYRSGDDEELLLIGLL